jgi:hypothetical protein
MGWREALRFTVLRKGSSVVLASSSVGQWAARAPVPPESEESAETERGGRNDDNLWIPEDEDTLLCVSLEDFHQVPRQRLGLWRCGADGTANECNKCFPRDRDSQVRWFGAKVSK